MKSNSLATRCVPPRVFFHGDSSRPCRAHRKRTVPSPAPNRRKPCPPALASSFGAEDMVLLDLIARTGAADRHLHARHRPAARADARADRRVREPLRASGGRVLRPSTRSRAVRAHAWRERVLRQRRELRRTCCAIRKTEPLARALAGKRAWITGLRREQSVDARRRCLRGVRRRARPCQVQSARRLDRGRRVGVHPRARRAVQRAARPGLSAASAARRARARSSPARTCAPAAGGGRTPSTRNAACTGGPSIVKRTTAEATT